MARNVVLRWDHTATVSSRGFPVGSRMAREQYRQACPERRRTTEDTVRSGWDEIGRECERGLDGVGRGRVVEHGDMATRGTFAQHAQLDWMPQLAAVVRHSPRSLLRPTRRLPPALAPPACLLAGSPIRSNRHGNLRQCIAGRHDFGRSFMVCGRDRAETMSRSNGERESLDDGSVDRKPSPLVHTAAFFSEPALKMRLHDADSRSR
nr:hypothetical protein CFP56_46679 [Quercus suber]